MKIIILTVDANIDKIERSVKNKKSLIIDTNDNSNKEKELKYIVESIHGFEQSPTIDIMIVRFSGDDAVREALGDEMSQMIINVSCEEESIYYISDLSTTISLFI